jgi:hypothetical protein
LDAIKLHNSLHGCCSKRGTGTATIKVKLAQQLSYLELKPFYGVFLDLRKAFNAMDRERSIMLLEGYGAGPRMIRLIRGYWRDAIMVCQAAENYGTAFNSLTAIDGHDRQYFNELRSTVVSRRIFIRLQSLIAR